MKHFELHSQYKPTGDQPEAIRQLTEGALAGAPAQTLLGVTGSGKNIYRSQCHCQSQQTDLGLKP